MRKIKNMLPFLIIIALGYCFLPLLIRDFDSQTVVLFVAIPVVCLVVSIAFSTNNSLSILYPVFVAILSFILVIRFPLSWRDFVTSALVYGIVALIGNAIGRVLFKRNVRINNIDKFGRYLIIAVIGSYIVATIASGIMMSQMAQITYNATAYGTTIRQDIIDFNAGKSQQNYYHYDGELREHTEKITGTTEQLKIKVICSISLFPLWQKHYHNPSIMDGDYYNIIRGYQNHESIVNGSNAYPLTYKPVMRAIKNAVG